MTITVPYLTSTEQAEINGQPGYIVNVYNTHRAQFLTDLESFSASFSTIDEETLRAAFAAVAAFWTKGYGSSTLGTVDLRDLANTASMSCSLYVCWWWKLCEVLDAKLFTTYGPLSPTFLGWNGGVVGNHAQVMVSGGAFSLLLDPTTGLIAQTDYNSLLQGKPTTAIADFYPPGSSWPFHDTVKTALATGEYKPSDALYYYTKYEAFADGSNYEAHWPTPQNTAAP